LKYELGPLLIDVQRLAVTFDGRTLAVAPKVVEALALLCQRAGNFVSKEELMACLWPGGYADDTTLWQKISLLRRFLKPYVGGGAIETLARRGYRLTVSVRTVADAPEAPRRSRSGGVGVPVALGALLALALVLLAARPHATRTLAPGAQRDYNLGLYFMGMRTDDSVRKAAGDFRAVIAADPQNALGYAGLAEADTFLRDARAMENARTAVRLDPDSAVAQTALGLAMRDGSPEPVFTRAIALDPQYAPARLWYGEYLFERGDLVASYAQLQRAIDLDPSLAITNVWLARSAYLMGDANAAVTYSSRAMAFATSDQEDALLTLGLALDRAHRVAGARAAFAKLQRYAPKIAFAAIAYVEAEHGQGRSARADLARAMSLPGCNCGKYWVNVALTQLKLGEPAAARRSFAILGREDRMLMSFDPRVRALGADERPT
jgi:DNA-binding winged helix-turn-helix (wHTH) protein/Tfp pilus assembly protein PilF